MNKFRNIKTKKGISLVVLVITIIVLIILAGATIGVLIKSDIIEFAKDTIQRYNQAQESELQNLENISNKLNNLDNKPNNDPENNPDNDPENNPDNDPDVDIKDEQLTLADGTKVTLTPDNFKNYLGYKVANYNGKSEVKIGDTTYQVSQEYRLYYVDFENKFKDGVGTIYLKAESPVAQYSLPITDTSSANDTNIKIKNLNPALYASGITSPSVANDNMKAVTWLTNTTNWIGLADTTMLSDINYIVGGPSLEMMMDSYNTYYSLEGNTPDYSAITPGIRRKIFYRYESSTSGYQVGPSTYFKAEYATSTSDYSVYPDIIDTMYYPGEGKYYWLSSPAVSPINVDDGKSVMFLSSDFGGNVSGYAYNYDRCLCPLVSLKATTKLVLSSK